MIEVSYYCLFLLSLSVTCRGQLHYAKRILDPSVVTPMSVCQFVTPVNSAKTWAGRDHLTSLKLSSSAELTGKVIPQMQSSSSNLREMQLSSKNSVLANTFSGLSGYSWLENFDTSDSKFDHKLSNEMIVNRVLGVLNLQKSYQFAFFHEEVHSNVINLPLILNLANFQQPSSRTIMEHYVVKTTFLIGWRIRKYWQFSLSTSQKSSFLILIAVGWEHIFAINCSVYLWRLAKRYGQTAVNMDMR